MTRLWWVSREGFLEEVSSQPSFRGEECGLASQEKPFRAVQSQLAKTRQQRAERRVHMDHEAFSPGLPATGAARSTLLRPQPVLMETEFINASAFLMKI